jgi:4-nitrophenyl phosphatase
MIDDDIILLKGKKLFVLDMDGTFYLGNKVIKGSLEIIEKLKSKGKKFLFFTNNDSKTPYFYMEKLMRMGCPITRKSILTAGDVTISYLVENHPGEKVFLVGTELLEDSFEKAGINLVKSVHDAPQIVVVGFDTTLTYEKISTACESIMAGALFFATHMDLNCPTEDGFIPDCGSICAMITASTGVKPRYFGKPFSEAVEMITEITGVSKGDMAIIGDRLYTDIAMGYNNNVTSILVLSGETKVTALADSEIKPDFIFDSIADINDIL